MTNTVIAQELGPIRRLRDRLAWLREQEYHAHQALLASQPCTFGHVRTHGEWMAARARIEEIERMLREEQD